MKNTRATIAKILLRVIKHHASLTACLSDVPDSHPDIRLIKAICFGTCRWYFRLTALAEKLMEKPLRSKDLDIYCLILSGLYELLYLNVPPHVVVSQTVDAAKSLKKVWATRLINAVLRNFIRQQDALSKSCFDGAALYAHPDWMIQKIKKQYPDDWEAILNANNQHPPLYLRVNQTQISTQAYLNLLEKQAIPATLTEGLECCIFLEQPQAVQNLPEFKSGYCSVQDRSAQYAASLLEIEPHQRILDACAAPGGKTTHLLEQETAIDQIIALDIDAQRLDKIEENRKRLKLPDKIKYFSLDATQAPLWWDGVLFDRILIDAPCSGSGVIRRHPDIKLLRRETDIASLAEQQLALLTALWPLLKAGGLLLYITCSIFAEENEQVIAQFMAHHADAQAIAITLPCAQPKALGVQILPHPASGDGFYYMKLVKAF